MSQSGGSVEGLQMGFKTMVNSIDQAVAGSGKGAESFAALGISVTDANGAVKDQETVFNEAVIALQGMEEGTEKAKLANDLFGRSGAEMMPLLNGAAGSIDEMKQQAHDLGLVLTDESIDAGVNFTDTIDQLQRAFGAAVAEIGVQFMPMIEKFANFIIDNMPTIQAVITTVFDAISFVLGNFIKGVGVVIDWLSKWVQGNDESMGKIKETITNIINDVKAFIEDKLSGILKFWDENGKMILEATTIVFNKIKKHVELVMQIVGKVIEVAWNLIKQIFSTVIGIIMGLVQVFAGLLTGDFGKIKEGLLKIWTSLWDLIKGVVAGAWDLLSGVFLTLWNSVEGWFTDLKDSAVDWGRNMIQGFIDGILGMINKVKSAVSSVISTVGDFLGFRSPAKKGEGRNITKWGKGMVSGFLDGVDEESKKIGGVMNHVIGTMPKVGSYSTGSTLTQSAMQSGSRQSPVINQVVNIHSPQHLTPSETARLQKRASQELALEW
ncbi:MAG: phage tail tape measure protein [Candidatus Saccharimonadales bacterium]